MFYWPICRAYARLLGDKPADALLRSLCGLHFWIVYHHWPNFTDPKRFSEKLWNRMLRERNPQFNIIMDKLLVRNYVAKKVGNGYLIPLLWSGDNPEEIPFDRLPLKFVMKTNHGCGYNIIVKDKKQLNQSKATHQLKQWLSKNFGQEKYLGIAWGYKKIIPRIIIESFIEENGFPPIDYKFYCFSGRVEILTVHIDRFKDHKIRAFDRNFSPYGFRYKFDHHKNESQRPQNFEAMVDLAETLAAEFDFMRVDLYSVKNNIYFGELTPYPGGVSLIRGFDVGKFDHALGKKWKMNQ